MTARDLLLGDIGAEPDLVGAALLRPGVRAFWLLDQETRRERAGFDWTEVSPSALQERLQIARSLGPHILSLRLQPAGARVTQLWEAASPKRRLEVEEAVAREAERAFREWLRGLQIRQHLGVEIVHPVGGNPPTVDLHVHILLFEASTQVTAKDATKLRVRLLADTADVPPTGSSAAARPSAWSGSGDA